MSTSRSFGESLHARLMLTILSAGAGMSSEACRKEATPARPDPIGATDATTSAIAPATVAVPPSAEAPAPAAVTPSADTPKPAAQTGILCGAAKASESCYAPYANARSTGTGEPAPAPPRSAYDKDGCLPKSKVTNGCCNPAVAGPRVAGGQCCYSFCPGPCCGRPFLVGGAPRIASLVERDDWLARDADGRSDAGAIQALDELTRTRLRDAWLADAQMEHASAAAFGRFVLQLLSLGAPAALVRDAALAAADEVRHAEMCFALASRLGAQAYGPMPLSLDGALDARTLEEVVANVVAEGCVGETIATLVASRQLEAARDSAVRNALGQIQVDEAKHAELAWSFVRWAIEVGGESARESAARAFARALDGEAGGVACVDGTERAVAWKAFGRLTPREMNETRKEALVRIVGPCARELLGARETSPRASC